MKEAVNAMQLGVASDVVSVALEAGVITADQGDQIKAAWANHLRS
ncbi:hypothetical protein [Streptomyces sp. NRRL WC-3725]|nr:hypothetical protein [Streptomyces sp. NRRL WC-3725]